MCRSSACALTHSHCNEPLAQARGERKGVEGRQKPSRGDSREVSGVPHGRHGATGVVLVQRQPKPHAVVLPKQRRLARQRLSLRPSVQFSRIHQIDCSQKRNQAHRVSRQREGALKVGARPQEIVLVVFREDNASRLCGCRLVNPQQEAIEEGCAPAGRTRRLAFAGRSRSAAMGNESQPFPTGRCPTVSQQSVGPHPATASTQPA